MAPLKKGGLLTACIRLSRLLEVGRYEDLSLAARALWFHLLAIKIEQPNVYRMIERSGIDLEKWVAGSLFADEAEVTVALDVLEARGIISRPGDGSLHLLRDDIVFRKRNSWLAPGLRRAVFLRDNYRCRHCSAAENLTIDHIKPVAAGGTDDITNLQTLCRRCNAIKGITVEAVA